MAAPTSATAAFDSVATSQLTFWLNGTKVVLDASQIDPDTTLLAFLRSQPGLTGTKQGCNEGGCGAVRSYPLSFLSAPLVERRLNLARPQCTVVLQSIHPRTNEVQHLAINACLAPLVCLEGKHCITVEGIGNSDNPHPLQERMFKLHGSQCGFCTPGIVRPTPLPLLLRAVERAVLIRNARPPAGHERVRAPAHGGVPRLARRVGRRAQRRPRRQPVPLHGLRPDLCRRQVVHRRLPRPQELVELVDLAPPLFLLVDRILLVLLLAASHAPRRRLRRAVQL